MNYDFYDVLCIYSENSCKADAFIHSWILEVCDLSDDTIKAYLKVRLLEMSQRYKDRLRGTTTNIEEAKIISVEHYGKNHHIQNAKAQQDVDNLFL